MEDQKFALLIDSDNISADYIKIILQELSKYGTITYKRIYGDWTRSTSNKWKDVLLANSINPVQQYSYTTGKNATDSAMIIDAMDILYSGHVTGFCLASSDSDFTRLAMRLRESGMYVIGMGERKTPEPFRSACEKFVLLDLVSNVDTPAKNAQKVSAVAATDALTPLSEIEQALVKIITDNGNDGTSMDIGELGSRLSKMYPSFDVRNYEYTKFSKFLEAAEFKKSISLKYTETTVTAFLLDADITLEDIHNEVLAILKQTEKHSMNVGELNQKLCKKFPEFNISNYGYAKLSKMLGDFKECKLSNFGKIITLKQ
ncbi:MAG: NYN domain-containing protein [Lachnospiraceae bacterium]|nr:NYN domain-containing protein [Lachnospiraceae bacterium]